MPDAHLWRPLTAALSLLTRVPVARRSPPRPSDIARGAVLFPLIGAALGALVGGVAVALQMVMPALPAATLAVALEVAITGALHLDGLSDSADGLAGRDPDRALEIMRDHSLGTYGAAALTLVLLAKVGALATLAQEQAWLLVVAAFAVSRAAPLPLAAALPYARRAPGTGRLLAERTSPVRAIAGVASAAILAVLAAGAFAAMALACLAAVVVCVGASARRRLGGVTGDVMGASIELTATLALVVATAAQR